MYLFIKKLLKYTFIMKEKRKCQNKIFAKYGEKKNIKIFRKFRKICIFELNFFEMLGHEELKSLQNMYAFLKKSIAVLLKYLYF